MSKVLPFPCKPSFVSEGHAEQARPRAFSSSGGNSYTPPLSQNRENPVFIDWLSVYQTHDGTLPVVGREYLCRTDIDTGEIVSEVVTNYKHKGSYDSCLLVRSDGARVSVSGNPSKFNRPDNLLGYTDIESCFSLYNSVLETLGLPPFFNTESLYQLESGSVSYRRSVITRVDLTTNYEVGQGNVSLFLSWLATQKHQRDSGHVYGNGKTVDWNRGSKRVYIKYYDKSHELFTNGKDEYLDKLANYCKSRGIIRHEISLKSKQLKSLGLDNRLNWSKIIMHELSDKYAFHKRVQGNRNSLHDISETLQELGYNKNLSIRCQMTAISWASGVNYIPDETISKSAFYRLRKPLLSIGIDISIPANVSTLPISVRQVEIAPFSMPDWYPDTLDYYNF